jgi:hypothetical protein
VFLLDANIGSELPRVRPRGGVLAWIRSVDHRLVRLSAFSSGEFQSDIKSTRSRDPARTAELERCADELARS